MPPRIAPAIRTALVPRAQFRLYSAAADSGPLVRVTNLPAAGSGHIRILELNRPSARNAISRSLLAALRAEIDDVHAQYGPNGEELGRADGVEVSEGKGPTRAVILASAVDACFCAGADLKERRGFTQKESVSALDIHLASCV